MLAKGLASDTTLFWSLDHTSGKYKKPLISIQLHSKTSAVIGNADAIGDKLYNYVQQGKNSLFAVKG